MKIVWAPQASRSLLRIAEHIANDKPNAALQWAKEVNRKVSRLGAFPLSGRIVPELGRQDIREIIAGKYRIIYKIDAKISIVSVFYGAKHWESWKETIEILSDPKLLKKIQKNRKYFTKGGKGKTIEEVFGK
jgi:toxin ParE1/3/4